MRCSLLLWTAVLGISAGTRDIHAQVKPKEDSGWTSLFNGKNFDGLYIRSGAVLKDTATQNIYKIEGDSIHVAGGGGLLTTKKTYSRYQMRVKYRYAKAAADQNAGLQYHVEPTDYDSTEKFGSQNLKVPYYFGRSFVQSIEFQTYVGNAGAYIGIGNLWARTTTSGGKFSPIGSPTIATPDHGGGGRFVNTSNPDIPADYTKWVQCQLDVYGADSSIHRVNGQVVVKTWKLRKVVKTGSDGADEYMENADTSAAVPNDKGHIGLQAEGSNIYYRDWEIRLLDAQGKPIIPGCMDPNDVNYNPLANQSNGSCKTTALVPSRKKHQKPSRPIGNGSGVLVTPHGMVDMKGKRF